MKNLLPTSHAREIPSVAGLGSNAENSAARLRSAIASSPASNQTPLHWGHTSSVTSPTGRRTICRSHRGHRRSDAPPAYSTILRSISRSPATFETSPRSNQAPPHVGHTSITKLPLGPSSFLRTAVDPSRGQCNEPAIGGPYVPLSGRGLRRA